VGARVGTGELDEDWMGGLLVRVAPSAISAYEGTLGMDLVGVGDATADDVVLLLICGVCVGGDSDTVVVVVVLTTALLSCAGGAVVEVVVVVGVLATTSTWLPLGEGDSLRFSGHSLTGSDTCGVGPAGLVGAATAAIVVGVETAGCGGALVISSVLFGEATNTPHSLAAGNISVVAMSVTV